MEEGSTEFYFQNPGRDVTRYDFSALFAMAWSKAMTLTNITAGFRNTGVCPFNRNAVCIPSEEPTKFNPEALPKSTGIKYIPLYSPAHHRQPKPDKASSTDVHEKSAPMISPVRHQDFGSLDCPVSPYSPFSSTLVCRRNPSLDDLSFRCGSLSLEERSSSEPAINKPSPMHFTLMEYGMNCFLPAKKQPSLSKFLHTPRPPNKLPAYISRSGNYMWKTTTTTDGQTDHLTPYTCAWGNNYYTQVLSEINLEANIQHSSRACTLFLFIAYTCGDLCQKLPAMSIIR